MTTKGITDIVFCLDASDSMKPCFERMRKHIGDFIAGLGSNTQIQWDWRIDFMAHSADGSAFRGESLFNVEKLLDSLYEDQRQGRFFTSDLEEFRRGLERVRLFSDEAPLIALDCCLDFPWRKATQCHRVVVLMTDEPFETAASQPEQLAMMQTLIEKIQRLRVILHLVAPDSQAYDTLSSVEKCEYEVVDRSGDGLASVDFHQVLSAIGKSVSVCDWQMPKPDTVPRGIFGQAGWGETTSMSRKDRA